MENKKYILYLLIIICVCFLLVGYFNYAKIVSFFNDKEWEFAESFATISTENLSQVESGKKLLVLANNKLNLYGNDSKIEYSENLITTGLQTSCSEDYLVVVVKDTNEIKLFKEEELMWENKFNWNILNVSVNKNGYVSVIYSQSGYKSSIKVFKPSGEELFTTYLASTYALDIEMSNDNKTIYIAEIDTEGIKIESNIKIIDVSKHQNNNITPSVEILLIGTDTLITDIEYSNDNKLLILTEKGIKAIDPEKNIKTITEFEIKNTLFANVNVEIPVVIEKVSTGIFTNETNLKLFDKDEIIEINIDRTPQNVETMNNVIALNLGNEVLFLNTNGKVIKRYELEKQLQSVKLFDKGNLAALIFRNKIELVKL